MAGMRFRLPPGAKRSRRSEADDLFLGEVGGERPDHRAVLPENRPPVAGAIEAHFLAVPEDDPVGAGELLDSAFEPLAYDDLIPGVAMHHERARPSVDRVDAGAEQPVAGESDGVGLDAERKVTLDEEP